MSAGEQPQEQAAPEAQAAETQAQESLLDLVVSNTKRVKRDELEGFLAAFTQEALKGTPTRAKGLTPKIEAMIRAVDQVASEQLAAVMHHPEFQKLEGTWRGLHHLVMNSETGEQLKIRVLNCTKRELQKDIESASEFDQSQLFKKIYESEFGMPGGMPYGALIGDYEFENHPDDLSVLEGVAGVAASAFCPFISAASHKMFDLESWTELATPRDLKKTFDNVKYAQWKSFRESEDSRFVVLTCPRTLARLPYGKNTKKIDEFDFEEVALGAKGESISVSHNEYCWMNTSYVLGAQLTAAFAKYGWCTAIRGRENGGSVEGLPAHVFETPDGDVDLKCPTEVPITDRREKELSDLGFLALCHNKNTDFAVFYGAQTAQKPKQYFEASATENAELSARLPYIMAASRFAHFLKVIARDKIGSFMEASDAEKWLNSWISNYVAAAKNPSAEEKAKFPLAEARVIVTEIPGKPGSYNAQALLRPWLQLETLNTAISMVTEIPKS